jgi:hypothetical protein
LAEVVVEAHGWMEHLGVSGAENSEPRGILENRGRCGVEDGRLRGCVHVLRILSDELHIHETADSIIFRSQRDALPSSSAMARRMARTSGPTVRAFRNAKISAADNSRTCDEGVRVRNRRPAARPAARSYPIFSTNAARSLRRCCQNR